MSVAGASQALPPVTVILFIKLLEISSWGFLGGGGVQVTVLLKLHEGHGPLNVLHVGSGGR